MTTDHTGWIVRFKLIISSNFNLKITGRYNIYLEKSVQNQGKSVSESGEITFWRTWLQAVTMASK
jgi:hypothetical protein